MALWAGLGQASTAAQLVGADVSGLISMIIQAVLTARHNRFECEQLAHRVLMIAQLLPNVKEPEAAQPLAGLDSTLRRAHELVVSCQERSAAYQFFMASRTAERFREVESKIDSYLILFPVISYIGITRRLERIYNVLVPEESTGGEPSTLAQLQVDTEVVQEILQQGTKEFTFAEIQVATNNFAENNLISEGRFGTVFRGRLQGGRLVAIQSMSLVYRNNIYLKQFHTQLSVLARLRHKHIVRLLGSYVNKDMRLLTNLQKIKNHLLTWWRKETNEKTKNLEAQIVYEYMENGSLFDHLHRDQGSSMLSPVIVSWKMRIDVLLGVSRAIEHLHCHANPPIIHEDISSGNILFDVSWVPHVSDFGFPVVWAMGNEMMASNAVKGTLRYVDPEYYHTGRMQTTNDVYSLGVVMLEVLTGQKPVIVEEMRILNLVSSAIPIIELGNMRELLDRRPVPEPTPGQLKALEHVAQTARCCVKLNGKDRPTISDIVANLKMAHELISRDDPSSVDELPNSPRASSVSSSCYYSDLGVDTDL